MRRPIGPAGEAFFSALTGRGLKRGVLRSIVEFRPTINRYFVEHNRDPQLFVWTKRAHHVRAKRIV
jgi:hypothetical protein